jgi:alpha-galactosidase
MKKIIIPLLFAFLLFNGYLLNAQSDSSYSKSHSANTPPLGFNSFDSYLTYLSEKKAISLIDVMAEKYKPFGYEYFVVDAGWYDDVELYEGLNYPKKHLGVALDEYGLPESSKAFFPSGIKTVADKAHEKGLKFGVWIIRGIPRYAVENNLPIKGTNYRARDIADTSNICVWDIKNYGVDMSKPGAQEYYNSLIDKIASFGVDFIKVDDMVPHPSEMLAIDRAIKNGGHKMLYSLSPGDVHLKAHLPYYRQANMLRITSDVWDNQKSIDKGFTAWQSFAGVEVNGFWPDLDMIPFGRLLVENHISVVEEKEKSRQSLFTRDQMQTFITQRALAASPLFIGGDLLTMDDYSYSLITNKDMLECNQNGVMGANVYKKDNVEVWITLDRKTPDQGWIGIFNRGANVKAVSLSKKDLGLLEYKRSYDLVECNHPFSVRDIWNGKSFTIDKEYRSSVPGNGVVFLRFVRLRQ